MSNNVDDLRKNVRRVFSGRTHKFDLPKFTVVQDKNLRNQRVIVAPYDKTVEKIEKLISSHSLELLERLKENTVIGSNENGKLQDFVPLSVIDAEINLIKKGAA